MNGAFNEMANFNGMAALETPEFMLSKMDELGSPSSYNHYSVGWAWAMNTPFQWTKQVASHWGGTRNGTIVHWPNGIEERAACARSSPTSSTSPHHPGGRRPARADDGQRRAAVAHGGHQHALHLQRRRRRRAPRPAVLRDVRQPRHLPPGLERGHQAPHAVGDGRRHLPAFDDDLWELYDGSTDYSQARDLAAEHPEMLAKLQRLWLIEATKYNVLPLDDRGAERLEPTLAGRPTLIRGNSQLFFPGMGRLSENSVVSIKNKSFSVTADVDVPDGGADGVIIAQGGRFGGWAVYVKDGKAKFVYNVLGIQRVHHRGRRADPGRQPPGADGVRLRRRRPGQGRRRHPLLRRRAGRHRPRRATQPMIFSADETTDIGYESGTTVTPTTPPRPAASPARSTGSSSTSATTTTTTSSTPTSACGSRWRASSRGGPSKAARTRFSSQQTPRESPNRRRAVPEARRPRWPRRAVAVELDPVTLLGAERQQADHALGCRQVRCRWSRSSRRGRRRCQRSGRTSPQAGH